jgi:hypothetical protein
VEIPGRKFLREEIKKFNSIQFNSSILMCRVNSQKANYRNSTAQTPTDSEKDTNETDTKTNRQINKKES